MDTGSDGRQRPETHLSIPRILVGREELTTRLETLFINASRGAGDLVLVPGRSGVGKTSLVEWLKTPVYDRNGLFIQAKFDQYQQNTPYYAVRTALSTLWRHIQAEAIQDMELLKKSMREAVGDLGSLLAELVPELREVFSDVPRLEEIGIHEARHRFTRAIRSFLTAVSQPDHPVVIFIDDWQWADQASLNLLRALKPGGTLRYFLLIASFRDEEIDASHPLHPVLEAIQIQDNPPKIVAVRSLSEHDIETFITSVFVHPVAGLDKLTRLIRKQTGGNPFFIRSLLEYLHENRQLTFDAGEDEWRWQIDRRDLPQSIVELFIRRLKFFNRKSRELLSLASCLGNTFDIISLSAISSLSPEQCISRLTPLRGRGFLLSADNGGSGFLESSRRIRYKFLHDRVQQAAFHYIDSDSLEYIQLSIGRQLMASLNESEQEERLFEILEHLNGGSSLIQDEAERWKMVELNMQAAKKAKAATAYRAMLTFNREAYGFAMAKEEDQKSFWEEHYDTALQLSRDLAESEFIEGDLETAEQIIRHSMEHTRTAVERAETMNIQIVHYTLLARYEEAISFGRAALHELDIRLPDRDYTVHRDREIAGCRETLKNAEISSLIDAPLMTDRKVQTATRLLITLGPPCYRTHQRLWSVIVPKVVNLTLEHGLIPQIGYSHTAFGGLLGWVDNDYDTAKQFGEAAEEIMARRFESPADQSVFYLMMGSSIRHWFRHLRYASRDYHNAYDIGLRSGNLQYAAYAFGHNMYCSFFQAIPLAELIRNTEQSLVFSRSRLNQWAVDLLEGGLRIFAMLSCDSEEELAKLENDGEYLAQVEAHGNIQVLCIYRILQTSALLLLNRLERAYDLALQAEPLIYTVGTQGLLLWPEYRFARFLIMAVLYEDADPEQQVLWKKELGETLDQFQIWAEQCPENQHHKLLFATAELKRIEQSHGEALFYYDKAAEMARTGDFSQWEGLANERASLFCGKMGNGNLAQVYWQQAYACFRRFGATAKVRRMEEEYMGTVQHWTATLQSRQSGTPGVPSHVVEEFEVRHLHLLRSLSDDKLEALHSREVSIEAGKLAEATERLRTEIAERKRQEKERLRLEEEIRHRHKMEAIGTLAGGIAHEFNNMLTIIIGNLEIVRDEMDNNREIIDCIEDIQAASTRARDVVQKLQRFAHKSSFVKKPIHIRPVVEDALKLLSQTIPATIAVQTRLACTNETILADPTEIHQVLINLCNNSVQAMSGRRGILEIILDNLYLLEGLRARDVELAAGQYIQLIVNDTGRGIPEEIQDRIFDPYFTTKDVDEGLGMGLAVVQGIVKNHDGAVTVESEVDRGTSFRVLFPLHRITEQTAVQAAEAAPPVSRGEHILFVDDEEAITRMNNQLFERLGYRITTFTSPQKALEAFRSSPESFDLVISDLTMPEMTGTELAVQIKKVRSTIPVIICTGHGDKINEASAAKWGVEASLKKPVTKREMEDVIREILEKAVR